MKMENESEKVFPRERSEKLRARENFVCKQKMWKKNFFLPSGASSTAKFSQLIFRRTIVQTCVWKRRSWSSHRERARSLVIKKIKKSENNWKIIELSENFRKVYCWRKKVKIFVEKKKLGKRSKKVVKNRKKLSFYILYQVIRAKLWRPQEKFHISILTASKKYFAQWKMSFATVSDLPWLSPIISSLC